MTHVTIEVDEIRRETAAAFLLVAGDKVEWCPKSQVEDAEQYCEGDTDLEMNVAEWWAKDRGLCE